MVPAFTLLLASVFNLFGVYSALSAWVILTIDSLFQALTAPLIYEMAARGSRAAQWALVSLDLGAVPRHYAIRRALDLGDVPLYHAVRGGSAPGYEDAGHRQ